MKKLFSALLALVFIFGMIPFTAKSFASDIRAHNTVASSELWMYVVMRDGTLWTWGNKKFGSPTLTPEQPGDEPTQIMSGVTDVIVGFRSVFAIKTDGSLWEWANHYYDSPDSTNIVDDKKPIKVMDNVRTVIPYEFRPESFVITNDGELYIIGEEYRTPKKVMDNVIDAIFLSTKFVLCADNTLWAFGNNEYNSFGNGTTVGSDTPVKVMTDVAEIHADVNNYCAVKTDGSLWVWLTEKEMTTYGLMSENYAPWQAMSGVRSAMAADNCYFVMKHDGSIWAFGSNRLGALNRDTEMSYIGTPFEIMRDVKRFYRSYETIFAVKTDDSLWVRGRGSIYTTGLGYITGVGDAMDAPESVQIMTDVAVVYPTNWGARMFALQKDGALWGWGLNTYEALTKGLPDYINKPIHLIEGVMLPDLSNASDIPAPAIFVSR